MRLDSSGTTYLAHGWVPTTIATLNTGEIVPGHWRLTSTAENQLTHESTLFGENDDEVATSWFLRRFRPSSKLPILKIPISVAAALSSWTVIAESHNGLSSIRVPAGCVDSSPLAEMQGAAHGWRLDKSRPIVIPEVTPKTDPVTSPQGAGYGEDSEDGTLPSPIPRPEADRKYWRHQKLELAVPLHDGSLVQGVRWPHRTSRFVSRRGLVRFELDDSTLRFLFRADDDAVHSLEVSASSRHFTIRFPNGRSRQVDVVPPFPLHSVIRVTLNDGLSVSINDTSIAKLNSSPGHLFALEAEGAFAAPGDTNKTRDRLPELPQPWVRHVNRSNKLAELNRDSIRHSLDVDRVLLTSGDELFGQITEVTDEVTLQDSSVSGQERKIARRDVRAVTFRRPDNFEANSVDGFFSRIDLVPDFSCSLATVEEPFWMRTALVHAEQDGLRTRHPILGEVLVHWKMIRRIRPLFEGTYYLLDPGPRHLGNAYRESFSRVQPDGTALSFDFELASWQLAQPTLLSADIAELIPSGRGTLKVTPFLDEVRSGFLSTRIFLNDELVGTLNELVKVRSPATDPERVRLGLPAQMLKEGKNTIQIRQRSAKDDATSFDDFEIRAIAIEIEHSP